MARPRRVALALVLSLPLVAGRSPPAWAYEGVGVARGGELSGRVTLEGPAPEARALDVSPFGAVCGRVPDERLVVGPERGIRYAVVTLEGVTRGKPIEREAAHELDNAGCRFVPHVQAVSVGQFLVLKNTDPILHTAHAHFPGGGQPDFNVGLYPGRVSRKPLVAPGLVEIRCEVHPWMRAYVVVTSHPYHAVTDLYGAYLIDGIPPGKYRVRIWHETLGTKEREVEISPGETAKADFRYAAPERGQER